MMFTDDVLEDLQSSNWVRMTLSMLVEPIPREHSHNRTHRACARGLFVGTCGEGWPKALTTTQMANQPAATA